LCLSVARYLPVTMTMFLTTSCTVVASPTVHLAKISAN